MIAIVTDISQMLVEPPLWNINHSSILQCII